MKYIINFYKDGSLMWKKFNDVEKLQWFIEQLDEDQLISIYQSYNGVTNTKITKWDVDVLCLLEQVDYHLKHNSKIIEYSKRNLACIPFTAGILYQLKQQLSFLIDNIDRLKDIQKGEEHGN